MTENLNTLASVDATISSSDSKEDALSTREFMEKNWDRLVINSEQTSQENELSSQPDKAPLSEQPPLFDEALHVQTAYDSLKEILSEKGISSKEEWLKSLIEMDALYHKNPDQFFDLMQAKKTQSMLQKQGVDFDLLKDAIVRQGIKNIFNSNEINQTFEAKNEQGFSHGVGAISHPYFNPTPQTKAPQMMDPLAPFKKPLTPNMSAYLKDLIQKEVALMVKKNEASTQKAKEASFAPKATSVPPLTSATHTVNGRLKTTREILEEGCKLLGI